MARSNLCKNFVHLSLKIFLHVGFLWALIALYYLSPVNGQGTVGGEEEEDERERLGNRTMISFASFHWSWASRLHNSQGCVFYYLAYPADLTTPFLPAYI